jgi:hypothetical protein
MLQSDFVRLGRRRAAVRAEAERAGGGLTHQGPQA